MPDIPWTPPPRRAAHGPADEDGLLPAGEDGATPTTRDGSVLGTEHSSVDLSEDHEADGAQRGTGTRADGRRTRSARRAAGGADAADGRAGAHPLDGMDPDSEGTRPDGEPRRRAWALWAVIGGAVAVVVAGVVVFALLSGDDAEPAAQTVTTTIDVPTPTTEPLDRADATALVQALPGTVRQFVLGSVEPSENLDGALEAWTATYSGQALGEDGTPLPAGGATDDETASDDAGAGGTASEAAPSDETDETTEADQGTTVGEPTDGDPAFTVTVGQWDDPEKATAGAQALAVDLGEPTTTEDVTVGGEVTGSLSYYATDGTTGTAVWTNGTVAIRATGPTSELVNFATAFGL